MGGAGGGAGVRRPTGRVRTIPDGGRSWLSGGGTRAPPAAARTYSCSYLFFGAAGEQPSERDAREREGKAVCRWCPVRRDCLEYALHTPEKDGLWGGLNEDERASGRHRR
ncbi:WhiB family transcriptional regulator [Nonomuraea sp. NPDC004354]